MAKAPDVDYLTRDYEGYRNLLLSLVDRSSTRWTERGAGDLGVTVVEILAATLDQLAYAGDRAAEEGFLGTARRWESVRRHAALGDYRLDRGNASVGYQHFHLKACASVLLPSGTQVSPPLAPGADPERRVVFETTEDALLDARRNTFSLSRSAGPGDMDVHLYGAGCARVDLSALGIRRGTRLAIVSRDDGEILTVAGVRGSAVDLETPIQAIYLAGSGDDHAEVLGNLAPIRRGRTGDFTRIGLGGASLADVSPSRYLAGRIAQLRALRREVEDTRPQWINDAALALRWRQINDSIFRVVRALRAAATLSIEQAKGYDETLLEDARGLRALLDARCQPLPGDLLPSLRVPLAGQRIPLGGDQPPLWVDQGTTLTVLVGDAGRFVPWTEVPNLLKSDPADRHFVVELDNAGWATLRFGDGQNGAIVPPDAQVLARWVTGDLYGGNLGARALLQILDDLPDVFDPAQPTWNPLPTWDARAPEDLASVPERIRIALTLPATPVTTDDYEVMLKERPRSGIAEAAARIDEPKERRVDVVIRPAPGEDAARVLASTRAFLDGARLAGSTVLVSLAQPLFISIAITVGVDTRVDGVDMRARLRGALLDRFGEGQARIIGVTRSAAEVYATVEAIPGVLWTQLTGFDVAERDPLEAREQIIPAPDQVVLAREIRLRIAPARPAES